MALLRHRVTVVIGVPSGVRRRRRQEALAGGDGALSVTRALIIKLLRVSDQHLLTENDLSLLLAEGALVVMILSRVEVSLYFERRLLLHLRLCSISTAIVYELLLLLRRVGGRLLRW